LLLHIQELAPEDRKQAAIQISQIAHRVLEIPFASQHTAKTEATPSSVFLEWLLPNIIKELSPLSRAQLAQTCRDSRDRIQNWRTERLTHFLLEPGLHDLLSFFFEHIPDSTHPESFDSWQQELLTKGIPTLLTAIYHSAILRSDEKELFRTYSPQELASTPPLLYLLLQTSYDLSLVVSMWFSNKDLLSQYPSLEEKALAASDWLQNNQDRITNIVCCARPDMTMTCLPQEICDLPQVKYLFLDSTSLRVLPPAIGFLNTLNFFAINNSHLTSLPQEIGQLANLMIFILDNNQLCSIPDKIRSLSQLVSLSLKGNRLTKIPDVSSLPNLKTLQLDGNPIESIPSSLFFRPDLQVTGIQILPSPTSLCLLI
jgi:Leucine-rich repeat (LRR) protein